MAFENTDNNIVEAFYNETSKNYKQAREVLKKIDPLSIGELAIQEGRVEKYSNMLDLLWKMAEYQKIVKTDTVTVCKVESARKEILYYL